MDRSNLRNLNILQWNCQSLKPKLLPFETILSQEKIHIAILSETWLEPESPLRIAGYNVYRKDRHDGYGGTAILTHNSVKAHINQVQHPNTGMEIIGIRILNCQHIENIISLYCPSSVRTEQNDWDVVFSYYDKKTIVAGDFNGHHTSWSVKSDTRGNHLFDASMDKGLVSLNDGTPTRLRLVNGVLQKSAPDVTFTTADIAMKFYWKVTNESLSSDHLMIKLSSTLDSPPEIKRKRNYKKANWKEYKDSIQETLLNNPDYFQLIKENPQESYDKFLDIIRQSADSSIPFIKMCEDPLRVSR